MSHAGLLRSGWSQGVRTPLNRGGSVRCSPAADSRTVPCGPCPPARLLAPRRASVACAVTTGGGVAAAATAGDGQGGSAAGAGGESSKNSGAQASAGVDGSDEAADPKKAKKPRPKRPAADKPWRPSRLRAAKPRFKTEEEAVAAAAAEEERRLFREQRRAQAGGGAPVSDPGAEPAKQEWYALKCLPEKERYSAGRLENLMMSLGLEESTKVYVARRQTLGDVLARVSSAAAKGAPGSAPAAAAQPATDALSATGLPINGGAVITEGMILLRCVMTPALTSALEEERSVLGFHGAMAPGASLARSRETDRLALTPVPLDAPSLAAYAEGVTLAPDGLAVARTGPACLVALPGGAFQLVTQNKRPGGGQGEQEGDAAPMSLRHVMAAQQPAAVKQPETTAPGGGERWRSQLQQVASRGLGAPASGGRRSGDGRQRRPPAGSSYQGVDGDL